MIYPGRVYSFHPTTWISPRSTVPPFSWETETTTVTNVTKTDINFYYNNFYHMSRNAGYVERIIIIIITAARQNTRKTTTHKFTTVRQTRGGSWHNSATLLVEMFKKTYTNNYKSHWTNIIAHRKYILSNTNCQEPTSWFCRTVHLNEKQVPDGSTLTRGGRHFSSSARAAATRSALRPNNTKQHHAMLNNPNNTQQTPKTAQNNTNNPSITHKIVQKLANSIACDAVRHA